MFVRQIKIFSIIIVMLGISTLVFSLPEQFPKGEHVLSPMVVEHTIGKKVLVVWITFNLSGSEYGEDYALVRREISFTSNEEEAMKNTIEELLKGPTSTEEKRGISFEQKGAKILSLEIKKGIIRLNLSKEIEPKGGSLAVRSVVACLKDTLSRFPGIKKVELAVEGKTNDIFQP